MFKSNRVTKQSSSFTVGILVAVVTLAFSPCLAQNAPLDLQLQSYPLDSAGGIVFEQKSLLVEDGYFKSEIRSQIVMTGEINRDRVRELLLAEYAELKSESGYRFRREPSGIYLYVYDRPDRRPAGWLGMLTWNDRQWEKNPVDPASIEPNVYLREQTLRVYETATGDRFGLTEFERVQVWQSFAEARDKLSEGRSQEDTDPLELGQRNGLSPDALVKSLTVTVARRFSISANQLELIVQEAAEKDWPRISID